VSPEERQRAAIRAVLFADLERSAWMDVGKAGSGLSEHVELLKAFGCPTRYSERHTAKGILLAGLQRLGL
jgi:hypothetical protein